MLLVECAQGLRKGESTSGNYTWYESMDDSLLYDICEDAWGAVEVEYIAMRRLAATAEERQAWSDAIVRGNKLFRSLGRGQRAEIFAAMRAWDAEQLRIRTALANGDTSVRPLL
jgi:hypothetical protein